MKKTVKALTNSYKKISNWGKILIFIILFLILISIFKHLNNLKNIKEGFVDKSEYIFVNDKEVYDGFYSQIYDYLVFNDVRSDFEIGSVLNLVEPSQSIKLLDIGSGTGTLLGNLAKRQSFQELVGIDISKEMIARSKRHFPDHSWVLGDALDGMHFQAESFTHITCFYFTVYYFKDKRQLFQNCFNWLMPGGYFILHLVNRENFDPILPPGNPLYIVSPQKYAKQRITKTKINFDEFVYNANFNLEGDLATFDEKFKFKDGKVRHQQQTLYMEDTETILTIAQQCGFTLHSIVDMVKCAYEYQYIYVFNRPS